MKLDFPTDDKYAAAARAESAALTEKLRSAQTTVPAEFSPQTAGLAVQIDGVRLTGGPYDGYEVKVPRGAASYERPAGGTDGFYPARYRRTAKRTEDGLAVFEYQEPAVAASA